jgi:hypothetical protein
MEPLKMGEQHDLGGEKCLLQASTQLVQLSIPNLLSEYPKRLTP